MSQTGWAKLRGSLPFLTVILISFMIITISLNQEIYAQNETEYKFIKQWGGFGTKDGEFKRPHDLDFDPEEKFLYVVDRDGNRIQIFDKDGNFIKKFGKQGDKDGQFDVPYGIDIDLKGNIWVADRGNHRVQKFDVNNSNHLLSFGSKGDKRGEFDNPRHVKTDKQAKYVYVADSLNHRIQKFDTNGTFIEIIGKLGDKMGEFDLPTTIEVDSKDNFYVTERGNERVQKFDSEWNPILMWGKKGSGDSEFCHIEHIGVDKFDNIYVNDPQSDPGCSNKPAIKKFDSEGNFITKWGKPGENEGRLGDPEHLAIDSESNVYVSDRENNVILKFKPVT